MSDAQVTRVHEAEIQVQPGDGVRVTFSGTVETVYADGRYLVRCPGGTIFYVNPVYQDAQVDVTHEKGSTP